MINEMSGKGKEIVRKSGGPEVAYVSLTREWCTESYREEVNVMNISVGNGIWWCAMAMTAVGTCILYRTQKDRTAEAQRKALLVCGFVVFGMYFLQRMFMFRDPWFWELYGAQKHAVLINLLPLHLCYSGLMLTMVGLRKGYEPMMAFGFYVGLLGAFLAMVSPDGYYEQQSVLHLPTLFFYLTHGLLTAMYACIGLLGLCGCGWKTAMRSLLILILLSLVLHGINVTGGLLGFEGMNYCYTMTPGGSGLLELLWSWIPYRWVYVVLPGSLCFCVWAAMLNGLYRVRRKLVSV